MPTEAQRQDDGNSWHFTFLMRLRSEECPLHPIASTCFATPSLAAFPAFSPTLQIAYGHVAALPPPPSPLARFHRKPLLLLFAAVARQEFFRFKRWPRNSTLSKNVSTLYQCGSYIKYVFFCFANSPNKLMFLLHKIKNNKTERRVS